MLAQKFPQIKTIASNYFAGECAYTQEFEVADDGIVEQQESFPEPSLMIICRWQQCLN